MTTVTNKTHAPLSIPLPRGKTLRLGPGKSGQISSKDATHPPIQKLVEAGSIEVVDEGSGSGPGSAGSVGGRAFIGGHTPGTSSRRSGDR